MAAQLLNDFYRNLIVGLSLIQNSKYNWNDRNKWGFFSAIIEYGREEHVTELYNLLNTNQFKEQQVFSNFDAMEKPDFIPTFIDRMFAFYLAPMNKDYRATSRCSTSSSVTNSMEALTNVTNVKQIEESHEKLKKALENRDEVCLFCWNSKQLAASHIVAQKNSFMDNEQSIFHRAGLVEKNQVQNGLLLCSYCHGEFDQLRRYVDVVNDQLVVKIVNFSMDGTGQKQLDWQKDMDNLLSLRMSSTKYFTDGRKSAESNNEMAIYFSNNDPLLLPNLEALKFHKIACLIWRMAGGADSNEEYCSDDDDCDYIQSKLVSIENWMNSSDVLTNKHNQEEFSDNALDLSEI